MPTGEGGDVEGEDGLRDVVSLADDFVLASPVLHLLVAHLGHGGMFLD